jgi:WD40 repeat protein
MRMLSLWVSLLACAVAGCDAVLPHSAQNTSKQQSADSNPMRPPIHGSAPGGPGSISAFTATFSPDGKLLVIRYVWRKGYGLGADKPPADFAPVRIWDVEKGTEWPAASEALATELDRAVFLFLPDGKALLVGSNERPMRLCEFPSGKVLLTFPDDSIGAFPQDVSPDGKLALAVHRPMRGLELWDVMQGKVVRVLSRSAVSIACFSPDGKRVFAPDNVPERTNAVAVWDTASGELRLIDFIRNKEFREHAII